ncbi:MAG: PBP1A family penicillin-binding protein, partial [Deltaproteobacteria bacterium]|nr:PBP1A family penicillin-binding protein [Deltaproteobacteria bacterium]
MSTTLSNILKVFSGLLLLAFLGVIGAMMYISASLPKLVSPDHYRPLVVSDVYAQGGEKIGEFYELRRKLIPFEEVPKVVVNSFVAAEDAQFFSHKGIDLQGIIRAAIKNFQAGRFVQGGSTITQQVAKSILLTPERKLSRKIRELVLAMRLEKNLSKKDILYVYLNEIYLGHGAYGIEAAAQNYFGKRAAELNLAEASMLAGLPQAPSRYSPLLNPKAAKERQIYVLKQMVDNGYISKREALEARDTVLKFLKRDDYNLRYAPYFVEYLRQVLIDKYGYDKVMKEGLQIYTTLNFKLQKTANFATEKGLRELDKRQGYRGSLKNLDKKQTEDFLQDQQEKEIFEEGKVYQAIVSQVNDAQRKTVVRFGEWEGEMPLEEMRWARKPDKDKYYVEDLVKKPSAVLSPGDLILIRLLQKPEKGVRVHVMLEQDPVVQGALLSFDFHTGFVKSMVGGLDFSKSEFNRALQGRRQMGSTFKPIIYGTALEKGYTGASVIIDAPIIYREGEEEIEEKWKPKNFGEKFYGDTILANALAFSRNVVTIKLVQELKIPTVAEYAQKLGIESPLIEDLSMALGSSSITLLEMCRSFSIFANEGKKSELVFIQKILDRDGNILEEYKPQEQKPILPPQQAYVMTHLLKGVVNYGTGKDLQDMNWPLAGKTGTTNDFADAWFVGYSPDLLTGVWVGFDERRKMGEH